VQKPPGTSHFWVICFEKREFILLGEGFQGYKVSGLQGFRVTGLRRFKEWLEFNLETLKP
jgi:hypothetical protein